MKAYFVSNRGDIEDKLLAAKQEHFERAARGPAVRRHTEAT
jgi:hypothetical protein